MRYRTGKFTVCRRICPSFSLDILQAAAVKGSRYFIILWRMFYVSPQVLRTVSFWAEFAALRKTSDPVHLLKVKYMDTVKVMSAPFAFQSLMRGRLVYSLPISYSDILG